MVAATPAFELLAVDLDGTLLDSAHRVPGRNRVALHRVHQAGVKIVLCTGRSFTETRPILDEIGLDLDAAVTAGGAILTDVATSRTIERSPIPHDDARAATKWFQQRGYAVLWLYDPDEAGFDGYDIAGPRRHANYDRWLARTPCQVRGIAHIPDDGFAPVRVTIVDEASVLTQVSAEFAARFEGRLTHNFLRVPTADAMIIEAFAWTVDKWNAVRKLCRRWRIDPRNTVAIGDDVNDLQMIRHAGLGAAVANGSRAVKDVARRITGSNDDCGVADLLDELVDGQS
jgi:Cof subfamily protein (haloacid dehalogenase superfamily)